MGWYEMISEKLLFKLNILYHKLEDEGILSDFKGFTDKEMDTWILRYKNMFQELFPNLTNYELINLLLLLKMVHKKSNENVHKVEIVASGLSNINMPIRETLGVIRQLLHGASEYILMTGYAISPYFHQLADLLNKKAEKGILIEIFIENSHNKNENLFDHVNRENFKVYTYKNKSSYSALHAKTIVVDNYYALITSANLSYSGMMNNVEIGAFIEGRDVKKIVDIFKKMKSQGLFELYI